MSLWRRRGVAGGKSPTLHSYGDGALLPHAVVLLAVALAGNLPALGGQALARGLTELLPEPQAGWQQREPGSRTYGPSNLFEYIDGNADLFLAYGFQEVAVGDYVRGGSAGGAQPGWISVDIYNMGTALHAFGIYRSERPPGAKPFAAGTEGYEGDGLIAFWGGPYYVKVALAEGDDAGAARALAAQTARHPVFTSPMPGELKRLPTAKRIAQSERYAKKDALGHGFLKEVVSADYKLGKAIASLHVADLGSSAKATEAWRKLRDFGRSTGAKPTRVSGVGEECFAGKDSSLGAIVAARKGRFVVIATSEKANRRALVQVAKEAAAALK
jgi:hypothetical protein